MARDPPYIGHAPVDVFGMNVLNVLRSACDVSQIPAGSMLASLGPAGGAAGVHEEERSLRRHRYRRYNLAGVFLEQLVEEEIAPLDHGLGRVILTRLPPPHQDLLNLLPFFLGRLYGKIGLFFVIGHVAAAVVAV